MDSSGAGHCPECVKCRRGGTTDPCIQPEAPATSFTGAGTGQNAGLEACDVSVLGTAAPRRAISSPARNFRETVRAMDAASGAPTAAFTAFSRTFPAWQCQSESG
jgi:hypothetical protein